MKTIDLKTGKATLYFDHETGALVRMTAEKTGWEILRREELGLSWRLLVPLGEELRNNPVYGEKQRLAARNSGEDYVEFVWDGVQSERGGLLDITVRQTIRAEGDQAVWYTTVENNSPYPVESVYSPYLGDLSHPKEAEWFRTFTCNYASADERELWPCFENLRGYHGVDYPTQFGGNLNYGAPSAPFMLLRSEEQGLYVGVKAHSAELVAWHCELRPGWDSSIDHRVAQSDMIAGRPVQTLFAPVHMCYLQPGEQRELTPIALEPFVGSWQQGADIYKAWRDTCSATAEPPAWAKEPHAWLQLHINSPEDELRLRFTELPAVARECAEYGVQAIQLVGWNDGGQDQGNPSHSPDPRLGTFEELRQAIAECQALGVKIILFAKFVWADRATQWFREELIHDAVKDPYGDYYMHGGYQYQTPAQLLDINTKRLVPMCFGSESYREVCRKEFAKLVELGCDGMLFDECLHHGPALLCFDPTHGHRAGWPVYEQDRAFIYDLRGTPGLRDDFLFSGEAVYDWELEAYSLSYHRSENKKHIALSRYLRPQAQFMTAVTGFNDRNMVNQCLLCRYIISYEPFNFKGRLSDYPDTVAYGRKMDALRTEYREYFWDGEYRDTVGAQVTLLSGEVCPAYSVFRAANGSGAVVLCNYEDTPVTVSVHLDGAPLGRYRLVDVEAWLDAKGEVFLPPRSAAIILP